jgi:nitric oxide dioxygenase
MDAEAMQMVRDSWRAATVDAEAFARLFYSKLFFLDPALERLFKRSMGMQGRKFVGMMTAAIENLGGHQMLVETLGSVGARHREFYGVATKDYDSVGDALLSALREVRGPHYTREEDAAWRAAYRRIRTTMISGDAAPPEASISGGSVLTETCPRDPR